MAYTKEPRALREVDELGSVVVRKIRLEVESGVIWMWRVVCGERGRGWAEDIGGFGGGEACCSLSDGRLEEAIVVG